MASNNSNEETTVSKSLLSDKAILKYMDEGLVVIEPFQAKNLGTASYDVSFTVLLYLVTHLQVSLGPFYYRETPPEPGQGIYNPFSESMVNKVWGEPQRAEKAKDWMARTQSHLENIDPEV